MEPTDYSLCVQAGNERLAINTGKNGIGPNNAFIAPE